MEKHNKSEQPEVYAVRRESGEWQISRREFLKAAGIGAAALGAGLNSGCSRKRPLEDICGNAPAHKDYILKLFLSADGKYLISVDRGSILKCWHFEKQALLGSMRVSDGNYAVGYHDGISCLFINKGKEQVDLLELPYTEFTAGLAAVESPYSEPILLPGLSATGMVVDTSENIYTSGNGYISVYKKADNYQQPESLYEPERRNLISQIQLFNEEKSLFVRWSQNSGFGVLDLESGEMTAFRGNCQAFAILPDNKNALICDTKKYMLVSLETGENAWTQDGPKPGGGNNFKITAAKVTPDGKTGILVVEYIQKFYLYLISMADGSQLSELRLNDIVNSDVFTGPVLSADGSVLTAAVGKTILYFSLPDLQLIGCPLDMNEAKNDTKGVEISETDSATGVIYTRTLPCGAGLPEGAVCTCNCVVGRGGCACDGHSNSNKNSGSKGGSHYWHPN